MIWPFGRNAKWDLDGIRQPWGDRPSIYGFLCDHLPEVGVGLRPGAEALPDDSAGPNELKFAAGALDGIFGHHGAGEEEDDDALDALADHTFRSLQLALTEPTQRNILAFYDTCVDRFHALGAVDPFLDKVREGTLPEDRLHDLAYWLATRAADREPVKMGIALLGLFLHTQVHEVIRVLGRHEEFTLFASVALSNSDPANGERHLYELARHVKGWGRIHIVERLAETEDPEIREWLLREGYKNDVMLEYLALPCALGGDLLGHLEQEQVDDDVLDGCGEILAALVTGHEGPTGGIEDYEPAPLAITAYVQHITHRPPREPHRSSLRALLPLLQGSQLVPDLSEGARQSLREQVERYLNATEG